MPVSRGAVQMNFSVLKKIHSGHFSPNRRLPNLANAHAHLRAQAFTFHWKKNGKQFAPFAVC